MSDRRYESPTLTTTIPPEVALDIDKPCSFSGSIDGKPLTVSGATVHTVERAMSRLGAGEHGTELIAKKIKEVLEEESKEGNVPPRNEET